MLNALRLKVELEKGENSEAEKRNPLSRWLF